MHLKKTLCIHVLDCDTETQDKHENEIFLTTLLQRLFMIVE